jgi:hypothetical protein
MARFTPLASCERTIAMAAAVPPSIARAPSMIPMGFFINLNFQPYGRWKEGQ